MLVALIALGALGYGLGPYASYREARANSISVLAEASTVDELQAGVGGLGVLLRLPDGSWIAIRYRDSHSATNFYSCAVALCSDGTWYECSHHHCGAFRIYIDLKTSIDELRATHTPEEISRMHDERFSDGAFSVLAAIERASSLGAAKELLEELGFGPLRTEVTAKMTGRLP